MFFCKICMFRSLRRILSVLKNYVIQYLLVGLGMLHKVRWTLRTGQKALGGGGLEQRGDGSSVFEPLVRGE